MGTAGGGRSTARAEASWADRSRRGPAGAEPRGMQLLTRYPPPILGIEAQPGAPPRRLPSVLQGKAQGAQLCSPAVPRGVNGRLPGSPAVSHLKRNKPG